MGILKTIIKQIISSKKHRRRSYSSSDRYRRGGFHNQHGRGHYRGKRSSSSYSSS